ncbi:hypothetical protein [Hymenobacter ruricola]|uniref:Uncharacterized protein n=1 Tax=Hymenobacter ruricola TaxID=2791023 RepID=A0ABS0I6G1_9BACT|nr:hypothetical protein [Hymenobacter ruricola]MBF9222565.1 hypothetical protein [Hymenobacter ruricola]
MTHKTYFQNFFVALCAALSDDEFLAFATTVLLNLERDAQAHAEDMAYLQSLVEKLRAAHEQRGPQGQSATAATLRTAVKNFLAWAKLTNTAKVFPAFPDRAQAERIDIFPGGMDALYHADQSNVLGRAKYYLDRISTTYGAQTKVPPAQAAAEYKKLEEALTGRTTDHADHREGSAAVDAEELNVCTGLYRAYAGLLHTHFEHPERAYAYFPFPNTTGAATDDNLPSLPAAPHPAG